MITSAVACNFPVTTRHGTKSGPMFSSVMRKNGTWMDLMAINITGLIAARQKWCFQSVRTPEEALWYGGPYGYVISKNVVAL